MKKSSLISLFFHYIAGCYKNKTDFSGPILKTKWNLPAKRCAHLCRLEPNCTRWVFMYQRKECHLKTGKSAQETVTIKAASGLRNCFMPTSGNHIYSSSILISSVYISVFKHKSTIRVETRRNNNRIYTYKQ